MRVKRLIVASALCFGAAVLVLAGWWIYDRYIADQTAKCGFEDPDFCRFVNANQQEHSYTATVTNQASPDQVLELSVADGQNYKATIRQKGKQVSAQIVAGGQVYLVGADGKWTKSAGAKPAGIVPVKDLIGSPSEKKLYKMGTRKCDNRNCAWYQLTDAKAKATQDIVFRLSDNTLYSIATTSKDTSSLGELVVYRFQPVAIKAPL